jgi:S-DNA-T family DNA segregation ATPase FtsK/SpoIIIE
MPPEQSVRIAAEKSTGTAILGAVLFVVGLGAFLVATPGWLLDNPLAVLQVVFGWLAVLVSPALIAGGLALALAGLRGRWVNWRAVVFAELAFTAATVLATSVASQLSSDIDPVSSGGLVGLALVQLLGLWLPGPAVIAVALAGLAAALWLFWGSLPEAFRSQVTRWLRMAILYLRPVALGDVADTRSLSEAKNTHVIVTPMKVASPASASPGKGKRERSSRKRGRAGRLPPLSLLDGEIPSAGANADVRLRAQILKQALDEFGVPVEVVSIKEGPTVTQFGLEPGETVRELRNGQIRRRRVSVASILRLQNDLALALSAGSIRIEAPVPGRPYVGIEVPNATKTMVGLRSILESREFARVTGPLAVAIGRDVSGDAVVADLAEMPHLLIAGATGSGKSVCINSLICSLLMNNDADMVRFVMVDPKMVELPAYNGIPQLFGSVITDLSKVSAALAWLSLQMDDRYRLFSEAGVRSITGYNREMGKSRERGPLPYIVLIIDELADLMMTSTGDIERQICRLAQ